MRKLVNFSVETDQIVLLEFEQGGQQRVPVRELSEHLMAADLRRVRAALKLRHDFLKTHLPKTGLISLAVLALLCVVGGSGLMAHQRQRPTIATAPPAPEVAAQVVVVPALAQSVPAVLAVAPVAAPPPMTPQPQTWPALPTIPNTPAVPLPSSLPLPSGPTNAALSLQGVPGLIIPNPGLVP